MHNELDFSQLILESNVLNFVVTFAFIAFLIGKFTPKAAKEQKELLEKRINEANAAKEAAEQKLSELESSIEKAKAQSEKIISEAKASAESLKQQTIDDAKKQIEVMDANAKKEIQYQKEIAIKEIKDKLLAASVDMSKQKFTDINKNSSIDRSVTEELVSKL